MIHPPQVRPEEPIAVTPHDGIYGGESQQWLSYPTNPHVRFDDREWEMELRRMAHATAPFPDSTVSPTMLEDIVDPPRAVRRMEVITGAGGRRRWSDGEKARILEEAMAPGVVVSEVARRHGMAPQHLFTWIRQARRALARTEEPPTLFVPALVETASVPTPPPPSRPRRSRRRDPAADIELEIAGVVVRIGADASGAAITAVIRALKASS
jgi:transposase